MKGCNKKSILPVSVLNTPPIRSLVQAISPSSQYGLFHVSGKRMCVQVYQLYLHKYKLFANLDIYQWRNQTQFPIVKTKYVNVECQNQNSPNILKLVVYNQHCPLKLNRIYEMSLAQMLYILKQSAIGFQRLLNRFGPFQIKQNMIAINEKGFCKVWMNQNYSANFLIKSESSEQRMVQSIISIMQNHCIQSKATHKLFNKLNQCKTFLRLIKQVHSFIISSRVLVPNRFVLGNYQKEIPALQQSIELEKNHKTENVSLHNIRQSIISSRIKKNNTQMKQDNLTENEQANDKSIMNQIKRFKSLQKLKAGNKMKISDGQTAYTRNNRQTKCSNLGITQSPNSPRQNQTEKNNQQSSKVKKKPSNEQSSFIMQIEQEKQNQNERQRQRNKLNYNYYGNNSVNLGINGKIRNKKQLSYSAAAIKSEKLLKTNKKVRKMSGKEVELNFDINNYNNSINNNKNIRSLIPVKGQNYLKQIETKLLINGRQQGSKISKDLGKNIDTNKNTKNGKQRGNKIEQNDEYQVRQSIDIIMKNNGWNCIAGFLQAQPKQLNQSFHEGMQVYDNRNDQKLEKLDSIGRKPVTMSILPQQYQDII